MGIYTKTGDKGKTSLFDNTRVYKDNIRVESYGTVDELGSFIGLAKNYVEDENIKEILFKIQNKLFVVASNLATIDQEKIKYRVKEEDIAFLEKVIDEYMQRINNPTGFIIPGSNKQSAHLHVARTICRKAERRIISLSKEDYVDENLIKYVNRLSDCIYALARYLEDEQQKVNYEV